jgi:hypothetical protein
MDFSMPQLTQNPGGGLPFLSRATSGCVVQASGAAICEALAKSPEKAKRRGRRHAAQRLLDATQPAEVQQLMTGHTPDQLELSRLPCGAARRCATWSGPASASPSRCGP